MAVLIVFFGAGLVIAGIIGLRLPAFLALIGAGLVVVSITPADLRIRGAARGQAAEILQVVEQVSEFPVVDDLSISEVRLAPGAVKTALTMAPLQPAHEPGTAWQGAPVVHLHAVGSTTPRGQLACYANAASGAPQFFYAGPTRPVAGDLLISPAEWEKAQKAGALNPGEVVAQGFGATTTSIGLLIALASIIGACLMESGAAERVVLAIRRLFGEERASLAFVPSGFLLCIPAFFDTVFYLLMPLGKAMRLKTGKDYLLYILSVVAGATMAHSLVPPTPGPSFVATALGLPIATMMLGGLIVGLCSAFAGYGYALWANRRWTIPLRDADTLPAVDGLATPRRLPYLGWSLVPILLPIALIALESLTNRPEIRGPWRDVIALLGNKNMALALGATVAIILFASTRAWQWRSLAAPLHGALESAGVILLITPAGGAFGLALRATDISGVLSGWFSGSGLWLLPAAFVVTMLVRLAQGSATVAMITGVGIVAPLAVGASLGYHPIYLALAIGCGSKPIPWMNDSGFWIISRMTGMTESETLKTASAMMAVMGVTGFSVTMLGAWLLPLV